MNGKITRSDGIELAFGDKPYISPNLSESQKWVWIDQTPEDCKYQGFFYDDEY